MIERGVTPHLSRTELKDLGYQLIVCPLAALYAATKAAQKVLTELKDKETTAALYDDLHDLRRVRRARRARGAIRRRGGLRDLTGRAEAR